MSSTYPSSLSENEWDCLQRFLPRKDHRDAVFAATLCARSSTPCFIYRVLAAHGATCHAIFGTFQTVYYHFKQFCRTGLWTCLYRALRDAELRGDRQWAATHGRGSA